MGVWEIFVNVTALVLTALLFVALQWAAAERAKAHRVWAARRESTETRPVVDWCVAIGAVVGWV